MTDEQLAALRAAAEAALVDELDIDKEDAALTAFFRLIDPFKIIALFDHIAKLDAGRDAVIDECATACQKIIDDAAADHDPELASGAYDCRDAIRALKSAPASAKEA